MAQDQLLLPHLPTSLRVHIIQYADILGFQPDQFLFAILCIIAVPIGFIHTNIPFKHVQTRHAFSTVIGLIYGWLLFGSSFVLSLVPPLAVYVIISILPPETSPHVSTIVSLGYLSFCHIYRMITDYMVWRLDFTGPLMISTVKSITFSYAYADGQLLAKGKRLHDKEHIHNEFKAKSLSSKPSFFHFMSFICFYAGTLTGPAFEIKHYLTFQDGSIFVNRGFKSTPSTVLPVLRNLLNVAACFPFMIISGYFPVGGYLGTDAYLAEPLWYQIAYLWFAVTFARFKYYFAWYLIEEGCIASGLGFSASSTENRVIWNATNNVEVLRVEANTSIADMINGWNKGVNQWLKDSIYLRVKTPKVLMPVFGKKFFPMFCARLASAFWHGFYPGYYMLFMCAILINIGEGSVTRMLTGNNSIAAKVIKWCYIHFTLTYMGSAFIVLSGRLAWRAWVSTFFIGHIVALLPYFVEKLFFKKKVHTNVAVEESTKSQDVSGGTEKVKNQ